MAFISSTEQRYRYYEETPELITVPVSELMARLPAEYRSDGAGGDISGRTVGLPCRQLLSGNVPRLSLGQLHDLLPDLVQIPEGAYPLYRVALPAGWLALHFQLITKREPLPAEVASESSHALSEEEEDKPEEIQTVGSATLIQPTPTSAPQAPEASATPGEVSPLEAVPIATEKKRGFFASLPMFQRRRPPVPVVVTRELAPVPSDYKAIKQREQEPTASPVALEPLWKLAPHDLIADPSSLQSIFMTEEKLSLERIIAMAGQLPGLRACVLAHGDQVVCASNTPSGIDLRTLSSQAMTMLTEIRNSSAKMGLGTVPAVTLHADQGVISFLHQGELCLLVMHADRGFIPGVRERLQEMLFHLSTATALPSSSQAQPSLPI